MVIDADPRTKTPRPVDYDFGFPLLIYGAGGSGRSLARHLAGRGLAIDAFLDANVEGAESRDGVPVFNLSRWLNNNAADRHDVLISLHNPLVDVAPLIDELRQAGFRRVLTMVDYINAVDDPQYRYWLAPKEFYRDKQARIASARSLLSDEGSQHWMDAALRLRLEGDYHGLPKPSFGDQYVPSGLPRWTDPMRLIDCGAFDGDSIETMRRAGYGLEAIAAFEPDPITFPTLSRRFSTLNAVFIPCGVSDGTRLVTFSGGLGSSSRVESTGANHIQCVAIDEAVPSFAPTLIKMDIEGSEPAALRGAIETIRRHRPGLAISLYHEPDHLWEIPLLIDSFDLDYRMFVRGHGHSGYDTVLYCIPRS